MNHSYVLSISSSLSFFFIVVAAEEEEQELNSYKTLAAVRDREHGFNMKKLSKEHDQIAGDILQKEQLMKQLLKTRETANAMRRHYEMKIQEMETEVQTVQQERWVLFCVSFSLSRPLFLFSISFYLFVVCPLPSPISLSPPLSLLLFSSLLLSSPLFSSLLSRANALAKEAGKGNEDLEHKQKIVKYEKRLTALKQELLQVRDKLKENSRLQGERDVTERERDVTERERETDRERKRDSRQRKEMERLISRLPPPLPPPFSSPLSRSFSG